jgi:hypothetical protein
MSAKEIITSKKCDNGKATKKISGRVRVIRHLPHIV